MKLTRAQRLFAELIGRKPFSHPSAWWKQCRDGMAWNFFRIGVRVGRTGRFTKLDAEDGRHRLKFPTGERVLKGSKKP